MSEQVAAGNGHKKLIEVEHLTKFFPVRGGVLQRVHAWLQAVDDVSFSIREGETLGLVGEFWLRQDDRGPDDAATPGADRRPRDVRWGGCLPAEGQ